MQIHVIIIIICTNERDHKDKKWKKKYGKHIVCKHNEIENDGI